jgi:hypothetical protein
VKNPLVATLRQRARQRLRRVSFGGPGLGGGTVTGLALPGHHSRSESDDEEKEERCGGWAEGGQGWGRGRGWTVEGAPPQNAHTARSLARL